MHACVFVCIFACVIWVVIDGDSRIPRAPSAGQYPQTPCTFVSTPALTCKCKIRAHICAVQKLSLVLCIVHVRACVNIFQCLAAAAHICALQRRSLLLPLLLFSFALVVLVQIDITAIPVVNKTLAWTGAWLAETAWSILPLKGSVM